MMMLNYRVTTYGVLSTVYTHTIYDIYTPYDKMK